MKWRTGVTEKVFSHEMPWPPKQMIEIAGLNGTATKTVNVVPLGKSLVASIVHKGNEGIGVKNELFHKGQKRDVRRVQRWRFAA